jgi:MoaD family protein
MQVTVKYRAHLAEITKITSESIEARNIKDIFKNIRKRYGAAAEKLAKTMIIVVNGQSILLLKHFKTALKNGDEVGFLPICGGG